MNRLEYLAQNKLGFEGDTFLKVTFEDLVLLNDIEVIIETGTFLGNTTKELAKMVKHVYTIEVNEENFNKAHDMLKNIENVYMYCASSEKILPDILKSPELFEKALFFLDAHWDKYNPLLDELKVIASKKLRPIIVIHDFKVPGHPELGFDSYAGQDYDFNWIQKEVEAIYGVDGYNVEYNSEATGAKRGVIILTPKN